MKTRALCSCGKIVALRNDGTMQGHKPKGALPTSRGEWCSGTASAVPTINKPTASELSHGDDRALVLQMAATIAAGWAHSEGCTLPRHEVAEFALGLALEIMRQHDEGE